MPAAVSSAWRRILTQTSRFSLPQKVFAVIAVAALLLGAVAVGGWLTKPAMTPLFTGLSGADASAIVDQLDGGGVSYELADGGTTILVPQGDVYPQRLAAAAAGLPSGTTQGYSLLDQMGVTAGEFEQDVTYKRALEGELANTLSAMAGVRTASVKLAIPEQSVFTSETPDPSASVFIETRQGATLSGDQVEAIVHLVASSVESMDAENVAVVDAEGRMLSTGTSEAAAAGSQASDYETKVQQSVQAMLDRIVGPGNSSVAVSADVSSATSERTETTFESPDGTPAINESTSSETYAGEDGGQAGIIGIEDEELDGGDASAGGADEDGDYVNSTSVRNNAVNQVTERTSTPAGGVTRQTVSVAVDSSVEGINVDTITDLVRTAAGIDQTRGDQVAVRLVGFTGGSAEEAQAALEQQRADASAAQLWEIIRIAVIALAVLLGIVLLFVLGGRLVKRINESEPLDLGHLDPMRGMFDASPGATALGAGTAATAVLPGPAAHALPPAGPAPAETDSDRKRRELNSLAEHDPAGTADLLRAMLGDGRPS